jgi:hypothetical protein
LQSEVLTQAISGNTLQIFFLTKIFIDFLSQTTISLLLKVAKIFFSMKMKLPTDASFTRKNWLVLLLVFGIGYMIGIFSNSTKPEIADKECQTVICAVCPACPAVKAPDAILSSKPDNTAEQPKYRSFYEVAISTPTDKVRLHSYDVAYEKYLKQYLERGSIKLLEIGLGCDMSYGPGASLKVWMEYFKTIKLDLHFMEYDKKCAEAVQKQYPMITIHSGDQANTNDLQRILDRSGGEFDVVIDDGGHTMKQQITTMEFMIPRALKPGGYFVMEDLSSSFEPSAQDFGPRRTTEFIHDIVDDIHKSWYFQNHGAHVRKTNLYKQVLDVDCFRGMCVLKIMPLDKDKSLSMRGKAAV